MTVGEPSLHELGGILSDDERDTFRGAIAESHHDHAIEIDRTLDELG